MEVTITKLSNGPENKRTKYNQISRQICNFLLLSFPILELIEYNKHFYEKHLSYLL